MKKSPIGVRSVHLRPIQNRKELLHPSMTKFKRRNILQSWCSFVLNLQGGGKAHQQVVDITLRASLLSMKVKEVTYFRYMGLE